MGLCGDKCGPMTCDLEEGHKGSHSSFQFGCDWYPTLKVGDHVRFVGHRPNDEPMPLGTGTVVYTPDEDNNPHSLSEHEIICRFIFDDHLGCLEALFTLDEVVPWS